MRYSVAMTNLLGTAAAEQTVDGNLIVATNVRGQMGYADINQTELAEILGLSPMAVTRRLSPKYDAEFSASEIMKMADAFGCDPGDLFAVREQVRPRGGSGAGRRALYLLDGVAPAGFEPTTPTVESRGFAGELIPFPTRGRDAEGARSETTREVI